MERGHRRCKQTNDKKDSQAYDYFMP